jgi:hypothetical protein
MQYPLKKSGYTVYTCLYPPLHHWSLFVWEKVHSPTWVRWYYSCCPFRITNLSHTEGLSGLHCTNMSMIDIKLVKIIMFQERSVEIWPGKAVLCADWMEADYSEFFTLLVSGGNCCLRLSQDRVQRYPTQKQGRGTQYVRPVWSAITYIIYQVVQVLNANKTHTVELHDVYIVRCLLIGMIYELTKWQTYFNRLIKSMCKKLGYCISN